MNLEGGEPELAAKLERENKGEVPLIKKGGRAERVRGELTESLSRAGE